MTAPIAIHAFVWAHGPELLDLWVAAWRRVMPDIDFEARRPWFVDHLRELEDAGTAIRCAFDTATGAMLGFVTIDPATGHLDQIAVAPAAQGGGAARALLAEARRLSPGRVGLDVNAANPRAIAFYRREGFCKIGEGVNPRSGRPIHSMEWRPAPSSRE